MNDYNAPEENTTAGDYTAETTSTSDYTQQTSYTQNVYAQAAMKPAKKGFATASLIFGIFALITTLFFVNYVFGLLSIIFAIVYFVIKSDVKPKGKAITGLVLSIISLTLSTVLWVSVYNYFTKTDISQIIEDVSGLAGTPIDGEEFIDEQITQMTGGAVDLEMVEKFVGGEVSVDRVIDFVGGDITKVEDKVNQLVEDIESVDVDAIMEDLEIDPEKPEVTYEDIEEKLGEDFNLDDILEYIEQFKTN